MVIPDFSEDLIKELDKLFPEMCPRPDMEDREIWMYAGKRELIRLLKTSLELQQEKALSKQGR